MSKTKSAATISAVVEPPAHNQWVNAYYREVDGRPAVIFAQYDATWRKGQGAYFKAVGTIIPKVLSWKPVPSGWRKR